MSAIGQEEQGDERHDGARLSTSFLRMAPRILKFIASDSACAAA